MPRHISKTYQLYLPRSLSMTRLLSCLGTYHHTAQRVHKWQWLLPCPPLLLMKVGTSATSTSWCYAVIGFSWGSGKWNPPEWSEYMHVAGLALFASPGASQCLRLFIGFVCNLAFRLVFGLNAPLVVRWDDKKVSSRANISLCLQSRCNVSSTLECLCLPMMRSGSFKCGSTRC